MFIAIIGGYFLLQVLFGFIKILATFARIRSSNMSQSQQIKPPWNKSDIVDADFSEINNQKDKEK